MLSALHNVQFVVVVVFTCAAHEFPVPSIMHKYCRYFSNPLHPTAPAAAPSLVVVLTFCVFNNIYLKAQTIGQKCANCSCKLHWAEKKENT